MFVREAESRIRFAGSVVVYSRMKYVRHYQRRNILCQDRGANVCIAPQIIGDNRKRVTVRRHVRIVSLLSDSLRQTDASAIITLVHAKPITPLSCSMILCGVVSYVRTAHPKAQRLVLTVSEYK